MTFLGWTSEQWFDVGISALIVALTLVFGRIVVKLIITKVIYRFTKKSKTNLDDSIIQAAQPLIYWLFVFLALDYAISRLDMLITERDMWMGDAFFILYFFLGFLFIWRSMTGIFKWYSKEIAPATETSLDEQILPFLRRIAQILIAVIAAIMILGRFDVEVSGLVATLGIGSLAIALAAQESLSDTISGFIIMLDRPFRIGDRIEVQDLDTWGDVIDIGLRSSRIRTRDNRMVIVPNSLIGKSLIVNYSYPNTRYRIQIHIGVAYGSDVEFVRNTIIGAVRDVEGVLKDEKVEALFLEFGDSALIFRVRWWLESYEDTRRMFDRVNTAIYNSLNDSGIIVPFPTVENLLKFDEANLSRFESVIKSKNS